MNPFVFLALRRAAPVVAVLALGLPPVAAQTVATRMPLAPETSPVLADLGDVSLEPAGSGRVPNYLRSVGQTIPQAARPLAHLIKTTLYGGTVAPAVKIGMGLRIARIYRSGYVASHLSRLLPAPAQSGGAPPTEAERRALLYAENLTRDVHGVSDADFAALRGHYNDSQIVELTGTVCFFNYFVRLCEGLNLPLEPWARTPAAAAGGLRHTGARVPVAGFDDILPAGARVALISDAEVKAVAAATAPPPQPAAQTTSSSNLGLGFANSRRAMLRVPDFADAWFGYWQAVREGAAVNRETLLQISFAVSMQNGCRYCTVHQVVGLRRLGVDPAKLVAMKKDDSALTPNDRAAVTFARKLSRDPAGVTGADWKTLTTTFGERGALDVLLQTCAFNFMNRFTDGLRLPSEDEAVKIYQEVYGGAAARAGAGNKQAAVMGG